MGLGFVVGVSCVVSMVMASAWFGMGVGIHGFSRLTIQLGALSGDRDAVVVCG